MANDDNGEINVEYWATKLAADYPYDRPNARQLCEDIHAQTGRLVEVNLVNLEAREVRRQAEDEQIV
jgi:hypothetical protein